MAALGTRRASPRHVPRSRQFGLTSAPMVPHLVQTIFGPNDGMARSPGRWSTFRITSWAALMTLDRERPHAVLAHVLQRHRLDRIIEARAGHAKKSPAHAGQSVL